MQVYSGGFGGGGLGQTARLVAHAGSTDYYYRREGGGSFRSINAAMKHLVGAGEGRSVPAKVESLSALGKTPTAPPLSQAKSEEPTPSRPTSAARTAPGSPRPPAAGSPNTSAPGSPTVDMSGPEGATPRKFGSLAALSRPLEGATISAPPKPESQSVAGGERPPLPLVAAATAEARASKERKQPAAAAPRLSTKSALAALGRDRAPDAAGAKDGNSVAASTVDPPKSAAAAKDPADGRDDAGPSKADGDAAAAGAEGNVDNGADAHGMTDDAKVWARKRRRSELPKLRLEPSCLFHSCTFVSSYLPRQCSYNVDTVMPNCTLKMQD